MPYKIGEHFKSQSKIQEFPVEYIYNGVLPNGRIHLISADGNTIKDVDVFPEWFDNRKITKLER